MPSPVTWLAFLDTNRDLTFTAPIDDITDYIIDMQWNAGITSAPEVVPDFDTVAPPARLTLQLDNTSGVFYPNTLGSEVLTNGGFDDWTADDPDGWTVTGESGSDPEISEVGTDETHGGSGTGACNLYSTASTISVAQNVLTIGTSYELQIHVSAISTTAGGLRLWNDVRQIGFIIQEAGYYTFYFNAVDSGNFRLENYLACNATIDSISIKPTSLYGKLIVPGALVAIQGSFNTVNYIVFMGTIAHDQGIVYTGKPSSGQVQDQMVTIVVEDVMHKLLDAEYTPPLLTDTTVDQVLQTMFDTGIVRFPYGDYGTLVGIQGTNIVGETARVFGYYGGLIDFEAGITEFSYVGDLADKGKGVSAQGFIRDLIAAEVGGRFFWNTRTGEFTFHNRHHDSLNTTVTQSFTQDAFTNFTLSYAEGLANEVTVNHVSRSVGSEGSVVYIHKAVPFLLKSGQSRKFTARYLDPNNDKAKVGIRNGIAPKLGYDYIGNSEQGGGGTDLSQKLTVSVVFNASSAQVAISNTSKSEIYVTTFQLRATPFLWQDETVTVSDGYSIARHGYAPMKPVSLRLLTDHDLAENVARDWLRRFKDPVFRISTVTLTGSDDEETALARQIGDRISISDSTTNHSGDYIIVGEQHHVAAPGYDHTVTWTLKPVDRTVIYLVGVTGRDEVGSANVIGL